LVLEYEKNDYDVLESPAVQMTTLKDVTGRYGSEKRRHAARRASVRHLLIIMADKVL